MKKLFLIILMFGFVNGCSNIHLLESGKQNSTITEFEKLPGWEMPEAEVIDVIVEPDRVQQGDQVTIEAIVGNTGNGTLKNLTVAITVNGKIIHREEISRLNTLEKYYITQKWMVRSPGTHEAEVTLILNDDTFDGDGSNIAELVFFGLTGRKTLTQN